MLLIVQLLALAGFSVLASAGVIHTLKTLDGGGNANTKN